MQFTVAPNFTYEKTYQIRLLGNTAYQSTYHLEGRFLTDEVAWEIANALCDAANNMADPPYGWGTFTPDVVRYDPVQEFTVPEPS